MIQLVCSSINEQFPEHGYKVVQPVTTAEHRRQRELHLENKRAKSAEKKAALLLMGLTESTSQDPDNSASSQVSEVPVLN